MRALVCTDYKDALYKLVCAHETPNGVYLAVCHTTADLHASYHTDGTHHLKHKGKRVPMVLPQGPPIDSIDTRQQIMGHTTIYSDSTMAHASPMKRDNRLTALVLLSHVLFQNISAMSLNSYILHRDIESQFLQDAYADYQNESFDLVAVNTFTLDNFKKHKVGLIFYRGQGQWTPESAT